MTIKQITSKQEYKKALARVDELWDAEPDTAEGDELIALVKLIEAYEQKHILH